MRKKTDGAADKRGLVFFILCSASCQLAADTQVNNLCYSRRNQMSIKRSLILIAALIVCAQFISVYGQTSRAASPDALVRELYRVHNQKHSPFFQTRSRALLYN